MELRRATKHETVTVFKGTEKECIDWVNNTIKRNRYKTTTMVDLNMRPVWRCESQYGTTKVFFMKKEVFTIDVSD